MSGCAIAKRAMRLPNLWDHKGALPTHPCTVADAHPKHFCRVTRVTGFDLSAVDDDIGPADAKIVDCQRLIVHEDRKSDTGPFRSKGARRFTASMKNTLPRVPAAWWVVAAEPADSARHLGETARALPNVKPIETQKMAEAIWQDRLNLLSKRGYKRHLEAPHFPRQ